MVTSVLPDTFNISHSLTVKQPSLPPIIEDYRLKQPMITLNSSDEILFKNETSAVVQSTTTMPPTSASESTELITSDCSILSNTSASQAQIPLITVNGLTLSPLQIQASKYNNSESSPEKAESISDADESQITSNYTLLSSSSISTSE